MNNAALTIHVQVLVWTYVLISRGRFLGVELLGCMVSVCLTSKETTKLFSKVSVTFHIPINSV